MRLLVRDRDRARVEVRRTRTRVVLCEFVGTIRRLKVISHKGGYILAVEVVEEVITRGNLGRSASGSGGLEGYL